MELLKLEQEKDQTRLQLLTYLGTNEREINRRKALRLWNMSNQTSDIWLQQSMRSEVRKIIKKYNF